MNRHDADEGVIAALRGDPRRLSSLLKIGVAGPVAIAAWVVVGGLALSSILVAIVAAALVLAYGALMALVAGSVAQESPAAMRAVSSREDPSLRVMAGADDGEPINRHAEALKQASPFYAAYFMNRLREEVKNARRHGHSMSVVVLEVTVPGAEMTPEQAETISHEIARIASQHPQTISLQLALRQNEFLFSMPHSDARATKEFVSQVVNALGHYWCHFGTATFPLEATSAEALVAAARDACETSRQDGVRGRLRQPLSA